MFREIRGVRQSRRPGVKRWFQDPYFDLHLHQDRDGSVGWFQLCYARDSRRERVLEWRRKLGFLHLKHETPLYDHGPESNVLVFDGVMPYLDVSRHFEASAEGLPGELADFLREKVREYARPARRFRRPNARTPRWLERLRTQERNRARLLLLGDGEADGKSPG
jgi:hypothetical protein